MNEKYFSIKEKRFGVNGVYPCILANFSQMCLYLSTKSHNLILIYNKQMCQHVLSSYSIYHCKFLKWSDEYLTRLFYSLEQLSFVVVNGLWFKSFQMFKTKIFLTNYTFPMVLNVFRCKCRVKLTTTRNSMFLLINRQSIKF